MLQIRLGIVAVAMGSILLVTGCDAGAEQASPVVPESPAVEAVAATEVPLAEETGTSEPAGEADTPVAEESEPPAWLADAQTYRDERVGFTLQYPSGWNILDVSDEIKEQAQNYAVTITSWGMQEGGAGGIPAGGTKVDVVIFATEATTLAETVEERRSQWAEQPPTILSEEEWTLEGGLPVVRWQLETMMGESVEVTAHINGYTVIVAGLGDPGLFDEIARTLRVIE